MTQDHMRTEGLTQAPIHPVLLPMTMPLRKVRHVLVEPADLPVPFALEAGLSLSTSRLSGKIVLIHHCDGACVSVPLGDAHWTRWMDIAAPPGNPRNPLNGSGIGTDDIQAEFIARIYDIAKPYTPEPARFFERVLTMSGLAALPGRTDALPLRVHIVEGCVFLTGRQSAGLPFFPAREALDTERWHLPARAAGRTLLPIAAPGWQEISGHERISRLGRLTAHLQHRLHGSIEPVHIAPAI